MILGWIAARLILAIFAVRPGPYKWFPISLCTFLVFPVPSEQWSFMGLNLWPSQNVQKPVQGSDSGATAISRVLNFFPTPVQEECLSQDKRRRGICMNTYECRIQRGKSYGRCALGFGVCCVFTASCDHTVDNNLTYVISPEFPNLIDWPMNCTVTVRKIDTQVGQLRIDFLHFNIGQPNLRTGVCDEDVMEIRNGQSAFRICGWNSGQHLYVDLNEEDASLTLNFRLPGGLRSRMWEMRIVQLDFQQRAPSGCLQYFQGLNGTLKTFNFLSNGRFLANQDYLLCIRQERGMCGISYSPCTADSFRIGPARVRYPNDTNLNNSSMANHRPSNANSTAQNASNNTDTDIEGSGSGEVGTMNMTNAMDDAGSSNIAGGRCRDRVLIPCDFEEFITPGNNEAGICNLEHCGNTLCERNEVDDGGDCRVETWATPFRIRVAFGPGQDTGTTLEDNIGMCLIYQQLPCVQ